MFTRDSGNGIVKKQHEFFHRQLISTMKNHKKRWTDTCMTKTGGVKHLQRNIIVKAR